MIGDERHPAIVRPRAPRSPLLSRARASPRASAEGDRSGQLGVARRRSGDAVGAPRRVTRSWRCARAQRRVQLNGTCGGKARSDGVCAYVASMSTSLSDRFGVDDLSTAGSRDPGAAAWSCSEELRTALPARSRRCARSRRRERSATRSPTTNEQSARGLADRLAVVRGRASVRCRSRPWFLRSSIPS